VSNRSPGAKGTRASAGGRHASANHDVTSIAPSCVTPACCPVTPRRRPALRNRRRARVAQGRRRDRCVCASRRWTPTSFDLAPSCDPARARRRLRWRAIKAAIFRRWDDPRGPRLAGIGRRKLTDSRVRSTPGCLEVDAVLTLRTLRATSPRLPDLSRSTGADTRAEPGSSGDGSTSRCATFVARCRNVARLGDHGSCADVSIASATIGPQPERPQRVDLARATGRPSSSSDRALALRRHGGSKLYGSVSWWRALGVRFQPALRQRGDSPPDVEGPDSDAARLDWQPSELVLRSTAR
jgi:hypothetical protein